MKNTVDNMTTAELEQLLAKKKKEENAEKLKQKTTYEAERDVVVKNLCETAKKHAVKMGEFNALAFELMNKQKEKLAEYGKMRKNSKGGFQLVTNDGKFKIQFAYASIPEYDERATKAEELLKDFLQDTIKKKDKGAYNIIMSLMERNKKGQLEYSRIQTLYKYENDYNDPRWKEAISLFKESFHIKGSKMSVRFYELNEKGSFELIDLNFSSL